LSIVVIRNQAEKNLKSLDSKTVVPVRFRLRAPRINHLQKSPENYESLESLPVAV
jgi:hypothetical protein